MVKVEHKIQIVPGSVDTLRGAGKVLLAEHYHEIARNKRLMVLDPDWVSYYALEEQDKLIVLAAWRGNELLGYSLSVIHQHLHYKELRVCQNDVVFVRKKERRGRLGASIMVETEHAAKKRGCKIVLWHAKEGTRLDELLGSNPQYSVQDIIYSKELL